MSVYLCQEKSVENNEILIIFKFKLVDLKTIENH